MENEILDDLNYDIEKKFFKKAFQFIVFQLILGLLITIFILLNLEGSLVGFIGILFLFLILPFNIIALVYLIKAFRVKERSKNLMLKFLIVNLLILLVWSVFIIKTLLDVKSHIDSTIQ